MANTNRGLDENDPFRQLRYLPPPFLDHYHHSTGDQQLLHPRPVRPFPGPGHLGHAGEGYETISRYSIHEGVYRGVGMAPASATHSSTSIQESPYAVYGMPEGYVHWRLDDSVPQRWRATVNPPAVNSPRPDNPRTLVPRQSANPLISYERHRREIPVSFLLCPDSDPFQRYQDAIYPRVRSSEHDPNGKRAIRTMPEDITENNHLNAEVSLQDLSEDATISDTSVRGKDTDRLPDQTRDVTLVEFDEVKTHTAKCDLCNNRNNVGMSRCRSCGWQSCHTCTIATGCFRTHRVNGGLHTGPINKDDLTMKEKPREKRNSKTAASQKRTASASPVATTTKPNKVVKRPKHAKKAPKASPTPSKGELIRDASDGECIELESAFQAARSLLALSMEAQGLLTPGQDRKKQINRTECGPQSNRNDNALDEAEEIPWSPLSRRSSQQEHSHRNALQQASRAGDEFQPASKRARFNEAIIPQKKARIDLKPNMPIRGIVKSKAQAFTRKKPGNIC